MNFSLNIASLRSKYIFLAINKNHAGRHSSAFGGGGAEAERLQVQVQPELLSKTLFKKEVRKKGEGRE